MVRAKPKQLTRLKLLRDDVVHQMERMRVFSELDLKIASKVSLGLLRKNSTQRHGVTRWTRDGDQITLDTVDLHPVLLEEDWTSYASFVMYHELIHAIGFRSHNTSFRELESLWPDVHAAKRGLDFTNQMRLKRAQWIWKCPQCTKEFPRQKPSRGKYQCRTCGCRLHDVPCRT